MAVVLEPVRESMEDKMPSLGRTLVTIATYNEIENLPALIDEIHRYAADVDILIIDDNSPDGTGAWCDERGAADPRVHCLHRTGKLGLGTAIIAGMRYAIEHGYDFVLNMDADFSHHPRYLPAMLAGVRGTVEGDQVKPGPYDVMIGSRYVPGGGVENWPLKRKLMSRSMNIYARTFLGLTPHDCSGGYRCYRTSLLAKLDFDTMRSRGYSFQEEVLWRLKQFRARFGETPIIFADREKGQSKIDGREAVSALRVIFSLAVANLFGRK